MNLWELSAIKVAEKIRDGQITSLNLVEACLERIGETDANVGAWAFLDPDLAREQASAMDSLRQRARPTGPLHGVPIGINDLYDTADMPTAWGARCHETRRPKSDAAVVDKLREAGAVILGKTVTTELAFVDCVRTCNPHNSEHTSGGSSAGSAAGVAAGHMPAAIGSPTSGSVIRSASFSGVYGFKPTRGIISRRGCFQTSRMLDQVGVMGRSLEDVALLGDVLGGHDPADQATYTRPKPQMLAGCRAEPPVEPSLVWFDLPFNDRLSGAMRGGLDELMETLGARVERLPAPQSFIDIERFHRTIREYEFCRNIETDPAVQSGQIHDTLAPVLERARRISEDDYKYALAMLVGSENFFASFFLDYDAIIAPSALGEAPVLGQGTGDPICSTIWTFAGLPSVSLPWLAGETGLPAGVQLIGSAEQDDRLLRTAAWLERDLFDGAGSGAEFGVTE